MGKVILRQTDYGRFAGREVPDTGNTITPHPSTSMFSLRPATSLDIDALSAIDHLAQTDRRRREFITRSVAHRTCSVIDAPDGQAAGYGVLDYAFFENGFVSMIYVDPPHRP